MSGASENSAIDEVLSLVRPELLQRVAYQSASPKRTAIRLHANENPWSIESTASAGVEPVSGNISAQDSVENSAHKVEERELNRYPAPNPLDLAKAMASYYGVAAEQLLAVRGSDDGIDLLLRAFCIAGQDSITISSPTFGMYRASAEVQGAGIVDAPLLESDGVFSLDYESTVKAARESKLLFICSPNNPTAHSVPRSTIESLCKELQGDCMVVVDEAYIEFSHRRSVADIMSSHSNLMVLRTLSKAFGAAGIRCGAVLAHPRIIELLRSISTPYALPTPVVELALAGFEPAALERVHARCRFLVEHCALLSDALKDHPFVEHVYPGDANFLLVRFHDSDEVYKALVQADVLVRDFSKATGSAGCLRISVGEESENRAVLNVLDKLQSEANVSTGAYSVTGAGQLQGSVK